MTKWISILTLVISTAAIAQEYKVIGEIGDVGEDGLYRIAVPHEVRSYAKYDLRDLRIWDEDGEQVPYFVQEAEEATRISNFTAFEIVEKYNVPDTTSTYIFKNPDATLEQAVLKLANYQGGKGYSLAGSHDRKQWFGLINRGQLSQLSSAVETSVFRVIKFPLNNYEFIKIVFDDRGSLPVNLLEIGSATTEVVPKVLEEIPVPDIAYTEKDNITSVQIKFERPEVVDRLRFEINAPLLYSRKAELYTFREREVKQKKERYRVPLASFTLRSDAEATFDVPSLLEAALYLDIYNLDNPRLQIKGLQVLQAPISVVASLKQSHRYSITAGSDTLMAPKYDIANFRDKISDTLPMAQIKSLRYPGPGVSSAVVTPFWQQAWFMWSCIGVAAMMIAYFAVDLLKDLSRGKAE